MIVNNAMPAAECGMTMGRSKTAIKIERPTNRFLARSQAKGIPPKQQTKAAARAAVKVRLMESKTSRSANAWEISPNEVAANKPTSGAITNNTTTEPKSAKTNSNQGQDLLILLSDRNLIAGQTFVIVNLDRADGSLPIGAEYLLTLG